MRRDIPVNGRFCGYSRKSRDDYDAFGKPMSREETLRRHRAWLDELADRHGITLDVVYEEVVSGETIEDRPMVQQVLEELADGKWDGVLCVDESRLARGGSKDRGIMCEFLEASGAFVITLDKVFDTTEEDDMETLEHGLARAHDHWKAINKFLKRGCIRSAAEGWYPYSRPPFGYDKIHVGKYPSLEPNAYAKYVVMAFEWIADGESLGEVARRFTRMGVPCEGPEWTFGRIGCMIKNEKYKGWNVFGTVKTVKRWSREERKMVKKRVPVPEKEWRRSKTKYDAIVSEDLWERANAQINHPCTRKGLGIRNPFAGMLYCPKCNRAMRMIKDTQNGRWRISHAVMITCNVKSCYLDQMMDAFIDELKSRIEDYPVEVGGKSKRDRMKERELDTLRNNLAVVDRSLKSLLNRLNHEIITEDEYRESKVDLTAEREGIAASIDAIEAEMSKAVDIEARNVTIHQAIDLLRSEATPEEANRFLRSFIRRIWYRNEGVAFMEQKIKLDIDFL